jgi:hypothetical protein
MRKHLMYLALAVIAGIAIGCGESCSGKNGTGNGANGNAGNGNGKPPNIEWAKDQPKVVIEAEIASCVSPFSVGQSAEAGGGKYLTLPSKGCAGNVHQHIAKEGTPERVAGSATLEFTIEKDADYYLWVRKYTCCSCGNSWAMQIDEGKPFTFGNQGTTHRHWSWLAHRGGNGKIRLKLKKGKHKLKIINRGDSGFRLDQILFWADTKQVPQGKEKPNPRR